MLRPAEAASAVARCTDPYVLAACLKQFYRRYIRGTTHVESLAVTCLRYETKLTHAFYRRLPRPLIPESQYEQLLAIGHAELEGGDECHSV